MKILHRFPISLRTRFIVGMAAMFLPEFCTERLKIDSETTGYLR